MRGWRAQYFITPFLKENIKLRFLMVDLITDCKPKDYIKGIKNVSMSEDFLAFHFPGYPVMPGCLLLESLVQLAGWLEARSSGFENWFLPRRVKKCSYYGFVLPGDQVMLEVRPVPEAPSSQPTYRGVGTVGQKKKIAAFFKGLRIPLNEIEPVEEARQRYRVLNQTLKVVSNE